MDDLHQELRQLAQKACVCPKDSVERQRSLDQMIRYLIASGKLWRRADLPEDDYKDILQRSWIYFCCNLCEATTATAPYNPDRASVLTWINAYIKMRVLDTYLELEWKRRNQIQPLTFAEGEMLDPIELLPAPAEPPPMLRELLVWVEQNRGMLERLHVRHRPDIHARMLILRRLPTDETPWQQLAQEFDVPEQTLRGFYRQKCLPQLRAAGKQLGYL